MCILPSCLLTSTTGQISGGARSEAILDLRLGFNGKSYAGDKFWRFDKMAMLSQCLSMYCLSLANALVEFDT